MFDEELTFGWRMKEKKGKEVGNREIEKYLRLPCHTIICDRL